jgi:hypothetical protein
LMSAPILQCGLLIGLHFFFLLFNSDFHPLMSIFTFVISMIISSLFFIKAIGQRPLILLSDQRT